jgi:hypothetical protein
MISPEELVQYDTPWFMDISLCIIFFVAMFIQAWFLTKDRKDIGRWLLLIGWGGMALRTGGALVLFGDLHIPLAAFPFLILIAVGSIIVSGRGAFNE